MHRTAFATAVLVPVCAALLVPHPVRALERYLYSAEEEVVMTSDTFVRTHPVVGRGRYERTFAKGDSVRLEPGSYLVDEEVSPGVMTTRYLAVAGKDWTVLQCTVGAFTGDYMDAVFHAARVPAVYYVTPDQASSDPTFLTYERDYGDDILLHLQPNTFARMDRKWKTEKANWSELTEEEILDRLHFADEWMRRIGYRPLSGFASYTPDNQLLRIMRKMRWNVLHSIIPEQNWSDGRWSINHWGMPNQPFYMASDDFRKQTVRAAEDGDVIGMTMNTYHPLIPHFLHWGDFVLSPSHFIRSHRTLETGYVPERYRNFFEDYLRARTLDGSPFFLVTGYEFGRTLGTRMMIVHNRKGGEIALELAKRRNVVFATARDVASWYERRQPASPETCFALRDYWTGSRQMDKACNTGPMISCELKDLKAVFAHLDSLPYYHYDYTVPWSFEARDINAPEDFARSDRELVKVDRSSDAIEIEAGDPLPRPVPVALWDAVPADASFGSPEALETAWRGFRLLRPAMIGDGRHHSVIILPRGFSGRLSSALAALSRPDPAEFEGVGSSIWRVQSIGETNPHCYATLSTPVLKGVTVPFVCPKECRIDAPDRPLGRFAKGAVVPLTFGPSRHWYRFFGLEASDIRLGPEALNVLSEASREYRTAEAAGPEALASVHAEQDDWYAKLVPSDEKVVLDMDCFGNKVFGQRSRAEGFDRMVHRINGKVDAKEYADGGIAFGPGRTLWENPQHLMFEISGLDSLDCAPGQKVVVRFTSWVAEDPGQRRSYLVRAESGGRAVGAFADRGEMMWSVDGERAKEKVFTAEFDPAEIKDGRLVFVVRSHRPTYLEDWYLSGGFMASVDRVVVTLK